MKFKRFSAIFVAIFFFLTAVVCIVFLATSSSHECIEAEDCSICTEIRLCQNLLHEFGFAATETLLALSAFFSFFLIERILSPVSPKRSVTLVSLKTKLNN